MKKIILATLLVCLSLQSYAQEDKTQTPKHEIKLNALYSLLALPEVSYEYLLNDESTIGASLLFAIDKDVDFRFAFTPYYRFFFGKKPAAGFFVEGFGMLNSIDNDNIDYNSGFDVTISTQAELDVALGLSIGAKFLTEKGFVFEIYGGIGRNLFNNNAIDAVPRAGISLGKRF